MMKVIKHHFIQVHLGKNKEVIGLFIDELGGKIMIVFVGIRVKAYTYLMDDDSEHKKAKGTKKSVIKRGYCLQIIKITY